MKRKKKVKKEGRKERKNKRKDERKLEGINKINSVINECFLFHVSNHYSCNNDSGSLLQVIDTQIR
jgi:hypothetical protein